MLITFADLSEGVQKTRKRKQKKEKYVRQQYPPVPFSLDTEEETEEAAAPPRTGVRSDLAGTPVIKGEGAGALGEN